MDSVSKAPHSRDGLSQHYRWEFKPCENPSILICQLGSQKFLTVVMRHLYNDLFFFIYNTYAMSTTFISHHFSLQNASPFSAVAYLFAARTYRAMGHNALFCTSLPPKLAP